MFSMRSNRVFVNKQYTRLDIDLKYWTTLLPRVIIWNSNFLICKVSFASYQPPMCTFFDKGWSAPLRYTSQMTWVTAAMQVSRGYKLITIFIIENVIIIKSGTRRIFLFDGSVYSQILLLLITVHRSFAFTWCVNVCMCTHVMQVRNDLIKTHL